MDLGRTIAAVVFFLSFVTLGYSFLGYPLLMALLAWLRPRPWARDESIEPRVSVLVCAHNEEGTIGARIENLLSQDYPLEKLQILVGSDGSTDSTESIIRSYVGPNVTAICRARQRGKSLLLNELAAVASGEILVFTDANTRFDSHAIRRLVRHFADPAIGYVSGYQGYSDTGSSVGRAESLYTRYENRLAAWESVVSSRVGADGAIFALRKELFCQLAADDINDLVLPLAAVLEGYRGVHDTEARAWETTTGDFGAEFWRRVRIANRGWRAVWRMRAALDPRRTGMFALQLASHRLLRWLGAYFAVVMFIANTALLAGPPVWWVPWVGQGVFYLAAGLAAVLPPLRRLAPFRLPYYVCLMYLGAAVGVATAMCGVRVATWRPVRTGPVPHG